MVLDEFHERSLHADLGLALARQAWLARSDLRLLVMSATLDTGPVARYLRRLPGGRGARRGASAGGGVRAGRAAGRGRSPTCCRGRAAGSSASCRGGARSRRWPASWPGRPRRVAWRSCRSTAGSTPPPRTGRCGPAPPDRRRVILATNIAETSLTVPGVSVVVDSGLVKVARYDAARGRRSAGPRAGDRRQRHAARRTGRAAGARAWSGGCGTRATGCASRGSPTSPGSTWPGRCSTSLAWGADPRAFEWFEPPPAHALEAARGAARPAGRRRRDRRAARRRRRSAASCSAGRCTCAWRGCWWTAAGRPDVAAACALLTEGSARGPGGATTSCDLLADLDRFAAQPPSRAPGGRRADPPGPPRARPRPPQRRLARTGCAAPSLPASPIGWRGGVPAPATG